MPSIDAATLKAHLDCRQVALAWGVRPARRGAHGPWWRFHCFVASAHAHGDRNPSLSVSKEAFHCFGCGARGSAIDLVMHLSGSSFQEAIEVLATMIHLPGPRRGPRRIVPQATSTLLPKTSAPSHARPPGQEVMALWEACHRVDADEQVGGFLAGRGLCPASIAARDLARALPPSVRLPSWARCRGIRWTGGYRLLVGAWDAAGQLCTLRARWVGGAHEGPKEAAAAGASQKGAVLACPRVRAWLRAPAHDPLHADVAHLLRVGVLIAEGTTDWLAAALSWGQRSHGAPLVVGIWSGAWTEALARRVPDGTVITIATDHDPAGHRYAQAIHDSLADRCTVRRALPPEKLL